MISVVLARPKYPRNIGQVSRAMTNTGFQNLILVAPQCEIDIEAREGAARGQGPLSNLTQYNSWDEFYSAEPDGLRVAFSRRKGRMRSVRPWKDYIGNELKEAVGKKPIYLIFGPEDAGLDLDDLERVNHLCELPVYGEHGSFNLAHAALIALFMIQDQLNLANIELHEPEAERHIYPDTMLKDWLETLGFDLSKPKVNAHSTLRRVLLENAITPREWETLESIVQQTVRKLKDKYKPIKSKD